MNYVYVIDTSYLLELYKIPGCYVETAYTLVKAKFKIGSARKSLFVVPVPCIFELANHIAHIGDGNLRKVFSDRLYTMVEKSIANEIPWIIPPHKDIDNVLVELCRIFANEHVANMVGLTDTYIIREAMYWKTKYNSSHYHVHIWTKDRKIKAYEPDAEIDPFTN